MEATLVPPGLPPGSEFHEGQHTITYEASDSSGNVASCSFTVTVIGKKIEGFHDAVRTPYALRPERHVGFFWNNKICLNFVSILFEKIKLTVSERTYIIVPMV